MSLNDSLHTWVVGRFSRGAGWRGRQTDTLTVALACVDQDRRQTAESLNSWLKARLPGRRARTYGQYSQHIDLLFLAVARNTLSETHHRDRTGLAPPGTTAA
jgi:hypothetical protein